MTQGYGEDGLKCEKTFWNVDTPTRVLKSLKRHMKWRTNGCFFWRRSVKCTSPSTHKLTESHHEIGATASIVKILSPSKRMFISNLLHTHSGPKWLTQNSQGKSAQKTNILCRYTRFRKRKNRRIEFGASRLRTNKESYVEKKGYIIRNFCSDA